MGATKKRKQPSGESGVTGHDKPDIGPDRSTDRADRPAKGKLQWGTSANGLRAGGSLQQASAEREPLVSQPEDDAKSTVTKIRQSADGRLQLTTLESVMLARVNAERQRYGLVNLEIDAALQESARKHCRWMATTGTFEHTSGPGIENIGEGQRSAATVIQAWMGSGGHRQNILDPAARIIGVAGYLGQNGKTYWVQQFKRMPRK